MDDNKTWQVIITNKLGDDQDRNRVISQLAALFKTEPSKAAQLVSKPQTVVREGIDETTARRYLAAINKTGAPCEIINKAADDVLPDIMEPVVPESAEAQEGLIRRPAADDKKSPASPELTMVEKERRQEQETRSKLAQFENLDPSLYCPQCGTIRSSADAPCLQCNYNPAQKERDLSGLKRLVGIAVIFVTLVLVAGYFAMPFYKQYAERSAIQEGLQLAIDTRNHITRFILDTNFWPNQNLDANLPKDISNDIVESIEVTGNGAFTVTLRERIVGRSGQTLIFEPRELKGKLVWNCTGGTLNNAYRPEICRIH